MHTRQVIVVNEELSEYEAALAIKKVPCSLEPITSLPCLLYNHTAQSQMTSSGAAIYHDHPICHTRTYI